MSDVHTAPIEQTQPEKVFDAIRNGIDWIEHAYYWLLAVNWENVGLVFITFSLLLVAWKLGAFNLRNQDSSEGLAR